MNAGFDAEGEPVFCSASDKDSIGVNRAIAVRPIKRAINGNDRILSR